MAVVDLIDDRGELAAVVAVQGDIEDLGDLVPGQPPQAELTAALPEPVHIEEAAARAGAGCFWLPPAAASPGQVIAG